MTHNLKLVSEDGGWPVLTIVDRWGDTLTITDHGGPDHCFLVRVDQDEDRKAAGHLPHVDVSGDDAAALDAFIGRECDGFPEPRWSDHDVVRWHNGTRWSTFIRVSVDRWVQISDDGVAYSEWHDHDISRLVDGEMFQDTDTTQKVEVIRQKLA